MAASLLLTFVASLVAARSEAQQVFLPQASFQGIIRSNLGGIYEYSNEQVGITPFSLDARDIQGFLGSSFSANVSFVGGLSPTVLTRGTATAVPSVLGGSPLGLAFGQANYSVSVVSSPGFTGMGSLPFVPITITGVTAISLTANGMGPFDGFADAAAVVSGPGLTIEEIAATSVQGNLQFGWPLAVSNPFTQFYAARPGDRIDVELRARGNLVGGEFISLADPTFTIDPTATFDVGGQPVRFVDAFEIQYSEGLFPIPEPGSGILLALGLGALAARGVRHSDRGRPLIR